MHGYTYRLTHHVLQLKPKRARKLLKLHLGPLKLGPPYNQVRSEVNGSQWRASVSRVVLPGDGLTVRSIIW